jgi:hypothetical protein
MTRLTTLGATVAALLTATASTFTAGCSGTPPGEFIVIQNQVPNDDCSIPAGLGQVYRGEGTLDVRLIGGGPSGYLLFPVLQNNFPGPSGGQTVDANRIALSGFNVDVDVPDDATGPIADHIRGYRSLDPSDPNHSKVQYSTLTSGSVAAGNGDTSSAVEVFPAVLAGEIRDMGVLSPTIDFWAVARVRALGSTLTSSVVSDSFTYPIRLCDGCLMADQGACPVSAASGNHCYIGQDDPTGCCEQAGQLICPSLVSNK